MPWSTSDLSTITDALHGMLDDAITAEKLNFNIKLNFASPETARKGGECQLTLYLLHVARDPTWRNTPLAGPLPQLNNAQPLSLNLYYLLTAWEDAISGHEQQAMSVALQCFHSRPIYRHTKPDEEFTISIEPDTIEEMSRLWQAFAVPLRLSAMIKVGVVFVSAPAVPVLPKPPPTSATLIVAPDLAAGSTPQLFGVATTLAFAPIPPPANPSQVTVTPGTDVAVGGASLLVAGVGLDSAAAADVFLSAPGSAVEWRVTAPWRQPPKLAGELPLHLPTAYAAPGAPLPPPPTVTPPPGVYLLTVGQQGSPQRSNAVPLVVAARVDNVATPPLLHPDATGVYTVNGDGFVPGATIVALDTVVLSHATALPPPVGGYVVDPSGQAIHFKAPANPLTGSYALRIRVNGVETPPNWVVPL